MILRNASDRDGVVGVEVGVDSGVKTMRVVEGGVVGEDCGEWQVCEERVTSVVVQCEITLAEERNTH